VCRPFVMTKAFLVAPPLLTTPNLVRCEISCHSCEGHLRYAKAVAEGTCSAQNRRAVIGRRSTRIPLSPTEPGRSTHEELSLS
jgi:hypothetical protein